MQPLLADQVVAAVESLGTDLRGLRDRAMLLLGFAGAFRRSELVALNVDDCGTRSGRLVVTVRRSKTDQEGRGRAVVIPRGARACAMKALQLWLRRSGIRSGPVFCGISSEGKIQARRVSPSYVTDLTRAAAKAVGLEAGRYGAHSLRAGYVTTAALAGVPLWEIKRHTGHSRETMVMNYIRDPRQRVIPTLL